MGKKQDAHERTDGFNPAWYLKGNCPFCIGSPYGSLKDIPPATHTLQIAEYRFNFCSRHLGRLQQCVADAIEEQRDRDRKMRNDYQYVCPVCGQHNERKSYSEEGIGTVEEYYDCDNCGFSEWMSYSPTVLFFRKGKGKTFLKRLRVRLKNWKKTLRIMLSDDYDGKAAKHL